jgi:hypothetical protein
MKSKLSAALVTLSEAMEGLKSAGLPRSNSDSDICVLIPIPQPSITAEQWRAMRQGRENIKG